MTKCPRHIFFSRKYEHITVGCNQIQNRLFPSVLVAVSGSLCVASKCTLSSPEAGIRKSKRKSTAARETASTENGVCGSMTFPSFNQVRKREIGTIFHLQTGPWLVLALPQLQGPAGECGSQGVGEGGWPAAEQDVKGEGQCGRQGLQLPPKLGIHSLDLPSSHFSIPVSGDSSQLAALTLDCEAVRPHGDTHKLNTRTAQGSRCGWDPCCFLGKFLAVTVASSLALLSLCFLTCIVTILEPSW